tara:strand:+ start:419 stop:802 length:384 start_codon:yes stop_codon:yes gene_type:complete
MNYEQFNINVLSDDPLFCTSLATECNKFGFMLTFFEEQDIGEDSFNEKKQISVNIIDIDILGTNPYDIAKKLRISSNSPVFGVFQQFNKGMQAKAKKAGYDLVFTKAMMLKSIKRVIIHISNEKKEV